MVLNHTAEGNTQAPTISFRYVVSFFLQDNGQGPTISFSCAISRPDLFSSIIPSPTFMHVPVRSKV